MKKTDRSRGDKPGTAGKGGKATGKPFAKTASSASKPGRAKPAPKAASKPASNKSGSKAAASRSKSAPAWMPESLVRAGAAETGTKRSRYDDSSRYQLPGYETKRAGKPAAPSHGKTFAPSPKPAPRRRNLALDDPHAEREAARYENPIASREALMALLAQADGPMTSDELAQKLNLTAPDRFEALSRRLAAMLRDGQLLANRRGQYAVARKVDLLAGSVIANPEGFGFLHLDTGGEDLFLPPHEMRKVFHGDRVLASVTGMDRRGRREGAIVEVLERRLQRLVGRYGERGGIGYVNPDDRRIAQDLMIPADARGDARPGQIVVAEIVEPPSPGRPPLGRILTVLGDSLTPSLIVETAIHGHGLPHEFPPEVLAQAAAVPLEVPAAIAAQRVDLRDVPLVTIDGEDAKDFDDAVWCEPNKGGFRLIVAIADVSHYVLPETPLDEEAAHRATSVYFPGFVIPMLPETLSNGICSLRPNVDRLCFACDMQIDHEGQVTKSKFYEAVMRSHARLTYTQVWKAVGEDDAEARQQIGPLLPNIERLHQLYRVLAKARAGRGAIEFETGEVRFVLDAKGEVVQAGMIARNDAHKLIEECMIAANVEAAKFLLKKKIPAPYRVHDRPPERKYEDLLEFLAEFKLRMPPHEKVTPGDFTALLAKVRKRVDAALIESVLLRSQSLAVYSTENIGHFGLALEAYAHFTSPIRRYPDLLVHRAIKHALSGAKADAFRYAPHDMEQLALQCSERGRRAEEAEREVDERFRAAWMEKHVGGQFDGVISGVTSFGLFVEMIQSKVTGLVHVTALPNDWYHFDPVRKLMIGERTGTQYRLGDPVRVLVLRASVEDRKIDLRLVPPAKANKAR